MSESGLMKPVKMCSCGSNEHVNLLVDVRVVQVLVFLYIFSVCEVGKRNKGRGNGDQK